MRRIALALLALAAAVPATAAETKSCLMLSRVQDQRVVDDRTVYFREGSRWYRNDLAAACPGLDPEKSLSSRVPSDRLCAGDAVTVFERGGTFTWGACPLGRFVRAEAPMLPRR